MTAPKKSAARSGPRGSIVRYDHGRAKLTQTSGHRWSDEAEAIFLDALAASANITHSAAECGFSQPAVHARRRRHADFAARWDAALHQGFTRLEAALIESAVDSMSGVEFDADRPIPKMTVDEAMNLYRIHAGNVGRGERRHGTPVRTRTLDELRIGLVRKIETIRREPEPEPEPEPESKPDPTPS